MVKFTQAQTADGVNISIDEATIIAAAKSGSLEAAGRLIMKHQQRIYNTVLRMCGNRDDADELTQESFVRAIEGIKTFNGQSSFYTWLFRIAVNLTLNFCNRNAKINFVRLEDELDGRQKQCLKDFLADASWPSPPAAAMKNEMAQLVICALEKLEPQQRVIVVLKDIENMNYAQIAETLQIELGTVKSRLARARKNLREIIEAILQ